MQRAVLLVLAAILVACDSLALAAAASISISLSEEHGERMSAVLTPRRVQLGPGEEVSLQLQVQNAQERTVQLTLSATVHGPSDQIAVELPATLSARRGVTRVPVRVTAAPSVTPGRYVITIAIRSRDREDHERD